ncbi:MAG: SDR family oxidoreductase [Flavobacteriales bacterium]|jgi:NAD(P)-dependent dehydrogenase (short-subunit alcohol dehydrogenase family)
MRALENRVAAVTGAASGIGKAIALTLSREGAVVIVMDLHGHGVSDTVTEIVEEGNNAFGEVCDVASASDVQAAFERVALKVGPIDILVNNAGVMDDFIPAGDVELAHWHRVMGVDLHGTFYCSHEVLPSMIDRGKGVILNISSIGGLQGARAGAAYTAAKHGVIGLTKNIAFMYAGKGIRSNAIAPGGVTTNIGAHMHPNAFGYERMISGSANMPRMADPDEIARVALFLVSDDASFVNGEVLVADGGWTAY